MASKSMVSACLALCLAREGRRVGLLDLDLTGPCDHMILGVDPPFPEERHGLVPPEVHGIRFMSITYFTGEDPAPLRGADISNALIELLAIVQWGALDHLVIDMPPGLSDALLDAVRLLQRGEFLVVATASTLVVRTVRRTLRLLAQVQAPVLGVLENMRRGDDPAVADLAAEEKAPFWGALPFDDGLEDALGRPDDMLSTPCGSALRTVVRERLRPR